jgi:hypothetical protein
MLTNFFLYTLYLVLKLVLSPLLLLSDVTLSAGFTDALTTAKGYISTIDAIFPLTTMFAIIGLFVLIETFVLSFKLITWIIKKIPFLG